MRKHSGTVLLWEGMWFAVPGERRQTPAEPRDEALANARYDFSLLHSVCIMPEEEGDDDRSSEPAATTSTTTTTSTSSEARLRNKGTERSKGTLRKAGRQRIDWSRASGWSRAPQNNKSGVGQRGDPPAFLCSHPTRLDSGAATTLLRRTQSRVIEPSSSRPSMIARIRLA